MWLISIIFTSAVFAFNGELIHNASSGTKIDMVVAVTETEFESLGRIDRPEGVTVQPAVEGVAFLWDNSFTMKDHLSSNNLYIPLFKTVVGRFPDTPMKSFSFLNKFEPLSSSWSTDISDLQRQIQDLKVPSPEDSKSEFFPVIIDLIQHLSKDRSDPDVIHLYIFSDGWDDAQKEDNQGIKHIYTSDVIQRYKDKLPDSRRIRPVFVGLNSWSSKVNATRLPAAFKDAMIACRQLGFDCNEDTVPQRQKFYFTIKGDICDLPEELPPTVKVLFSSFKQQRSQCVTSNDSSRLLWGLWLVLIAGGTVLAFWWRDHRKKEKRVEIRNKVWEERKATVIHGEGNESNTQPNKSTHKTAELTDVLTYKVSLIDLSAVENIGNYSSDQTKKVLIGGLETCDLVLNNPYVSGEHVRLLFKPTFVVVEDLGSSNGTMYNNLPLKPNVQQRVEHGGLITLGHVSSQIQVLIQE